MSQSPPRSIRSEEEDGPRPAIHYFADYGIFVALLLLVLLLAIVTPIVRHQQLFLTYRNLTQVVLQAAINLVISVGMTFVITSGGIDLSVGAIVALSGLAAAFAMKAGVGVFGGFLAALCAGLLCGGCNGWLITRLRLPPFIVTLGTMGIFRGAALIISEGRPIYDFTPDFLKIFASNFGPIPVQVLMALAVAGGGWFMLNETRFGRYSMAIGGNEEAARLAGIPVGPHKLKVYALAGLLTGIAGAMLTARLSSADPNHGVAYELDAIAATIMGGTSLTGGTGSIPGSVVGSLIISLVQNALNILNVPSFWQPFVIGWVIIVAVMIDQWRRGELRSRSTG